MTMLTLVGADTLNDEAGGEELEDCAKASKARALVSRSVESIACEGASQARSVGCGESLGGFPDKASVS